MKKKQNPILCLIIFCFIGGIGIAFCLPIKEPPTIKVMASIFPLQEFAQAVAGDRGEVQLLLPPGAEIHAWQPKPSDLVKLSAADVFIFIGAQLEPWADDILRSVRNPALHVIEASKGLSLIGQEKGGHEHEHGAIDPHIWLDFANDGKIIEEIAEVLCQLDPGGEVYFLKNAVAYKEKLDDLDAKFRKGLSQCEQKTIVLGGHAAFGYLARRYGLSQISLYGLSPDSKPTPRQLIDVVDYVKENRVGAIFFEINVSNDLARVIAKETEAKTLVLNPGASLPRKQGHSRITFLNLMEENLRNLKNGLRCR